MRARGEGKGGCGPGGCWSIRGGALSVRERRPDNRTHRDTQVTSGGHRGPTGKEATAGEPRQLQQWESEVHVPEHSRHAGQPWRCLLGFCCPPPPSPRPGVRGQDVTEPGLAPLSSLGVPNQLPWGWADLVSSLPAPAALTGTAHLGRRGRHGPGCSVRVPPKGLNTLSLPPPLLTCEKVGWMGGTAQRRTRRPLSEGFWPIFSLFQSGSGGPGRPVAAQGHTAQAERPMKRRPRSPPGAPFPVPSWPSPGPHPDRVHQALHLGRVQHGRQRPDEHAERHVVHGVYAARVDAAALRAAARPGPLVRPPASASPAQRASCAHSHGASAPAAAFPALTPADRTIRQDRAGCGSHGGVRSSRGQLGGRPADPAVTLRGGTGPELAGLRGSSDTRRGLSARGPPAASPWPLVGAPGPADSG